MLLAFYCVIEYLTRELVRRTHLYEELSSLTFYIKILNVYFVAQKLPDRVLGKLGLEQSKSRYVPLHAFSRQLTWPGPDRAEISVSCPLPKYFRQTLNQLVLNPPPEDKKK